MDEPIKEEEPYGMASFEMNFHSGLCCDTGPKDKPDVKPESGQYKRKASLFAEN